MSSQASRVGSAEPGSTVARLLDATERLVGERGIELVSLRSINAESGGNVAAVHYHFGSKEALVTAVLERRMNVLAKERLALLEPLETVRRPPLRAPVEVLVAPLARLAASDDGHAYVRFLAALDRAAHPWRRLVSDAFAPQWERLEPVLARALPGLPEDVLRFSLSVAASTLLDVLSDPQRHTSRLEGQPLLDAVVDVVTGILSGPATRRKQKP